jgi:two-component system chemotaxis response regulator CheB
MPFRFVAVGTSLGGFDALSRVLGGLPADFTLPIAVVQHRSHADSEDFAALLSAHGRRPVVEVADKDEIRDGRVYVCPSNYHLLVEGGQFALSTDAPVLFARPSIDVLFESAAEAFGSGVIGVLLTGMSRDGTDGLRKIKDAGGYVIVQDPAEAEGRIMPKAAVESVAVDRILALDEIAPFLATLCAGQRARR